MRNSIIFNLNKWLLFFLILYSADGISFFNHHVTPVSLIFLLGISFYWFIRSNVRLSGFIILMIPWLVYCLLSFFVFNAVRPMFLITLPISFFSAYVLIKSNLNLKMIFNSFERIIFIFTKISLFFFSWQNLHKNSFISIFSFFDFNNGESINNIVYTMHHRSISGELNQNSGFCWEPGPFSCFLALSLTIYLLKTNFKLDRRVLIYVIAILTTFSTTGYLCLIIIICMFIYIKYKNRFFLFLSPIVLTLSILTYFNIEFLNNKIYDQFNNAEYDLEFYIENNPDKRTSIGRFNGILLNLKDFKRYPILGFGGNFEDTYSEENNLNITSTTGLGNYL
ncbi:O-antigen ligase family protein, partial [bacterium]|nr:O-antigen ligase family protein [bacterium]